MGHVARDHLGQEMGHGQGQHQIERSRTLPLGYPLLHVQHDDDARPALARLWCRSGINTFLSTSQRLLGRPFLVSGLRRELSLVRWRLVASIGRGFSAFPLNGHYWKKVFCQWKWFCWGYIMVADDWRFGIRLGNGLLIGIGKMVCLNDFVELQILLKVYAEKKLWL